MVPCNNVEGCVVNDWSDIVTCSPSHVLGGELNGAMVVYITDVPTE